MLNIFSQEETNTGRQRELDYAKVISIVFMIIIHVWEKLSCYNVVAEAPEGFWQNFLQFGAGPLAAPVFMFCLGVGVLYTRHGSPAELARRGLLIFLGGYLLNFAREGIWQYLLYKPEDIWESDTIVYALLNGDILHFAGLAFLLTALLRALHVPVWLVCVLAVLMLYQGEGLSEESELEDRSRYFYGLFYYLKVASFPLLQWFVYPAFGMLFGQCLRHITDKGKMYAVLLPATLAALFALQNSAATEGFDITSTYILQYDIYYQQEIFHFLYTISFILIELSLLHFLTQSIEGSIDEAALFIGKNLTGIYAVQWVLIGAISYYQWTNDVDGFSATASTLLGLALAALSVLLAKVKSDLTSAFDK